MRIRRSWESKRPAVLRAVSPDKEIERTRQTASVGLHGVGMLHAVHHVIGNLYIGGQGCGPNSFASTSTLTAAKIHWPLGSGRAEHCR